ncbi:MAG TPA: polysaccharide deacetylase family protein [Bryobacteraceae bacterium]|nr:polysaccharide deacetylase family protein [Bryobacteraceae bacterium]
MKRKTFVLLALGLAAVAFVLFVVWRSRLPRTDPALQASLQSVTDSYRKIIVLMDDAESLDDATRARATAAGRILYWQKLHTLTEIGSRLTATGARDPYGMRQVVRYLTADPALHDADKLAFADLVEELLDSVTQPGAGKTDRELAESLGNLWDNLKSIQGTYREEVSRIFSQFGTRGGKATREKWDAYVQFLRTLSNRDKILQEMADLLTPEPTASSRGGSAEVFGTDFAPKTVALTFDDGPHPKYTEQVLAILRKYGIKACFFELGENLGTVDANGGVKLGPTADVARKVLDAGHAIANHSYSHPVLPKLPDAQRASEIDRTNLLLAKVMGHNTDLFRAPYGARNKEILEQVTEEGMKSVMWNVDSMDWADPIPESIAMRVLHQMNQTHRGIILFHDIHKQGVLALSPVIEELLRQDYTFVAPENGKFVKAALPPPPARAGEPPASTAAAAPGEPKRSFYRESWAVIIGINDYQNWPKLRYAVNDANGMEEVLTSKFGFKKEHIYKLLNGDATRQRVMQVLGDELTDTNKVQREDRVFFFFAGHGTTRTFEDGRQVGFIVPVDADQNNYVSTAISMSQIREASDLIPAKHVYFVMDSCYSGLALSRGSGAYSKDRSYLEEITRREARQILTAGGADQQVADDGPNGHSVFTWAVLQGLQGEADLDGNGVITASELGAYVSPIVAKFANQTPAVGNLVGSEGGEFVFELQPELLTSHTTQEDSKAVELNQQLSGLEKEIAAKQQELLKLQQSIQAESAKLTQANRSGEAAPPPPAPAAIARKPLTPAYELDRQGLELFRQKKYDEALQKFQGAAELRPNDPVILNNLGFLDYTVGRYDDALTNLQKTLALDPKRKEAHENLADTFFKMGRKEDAKKEYQQFLALSPASARAEEVKKILKTLE